MAPRTTLNQKNLEALGAERLARLLIEVSTGDANAKRRLRLELANEAGPGRAAHEVRKRLTAISNARSRIGWKTRKSVLADLETQRRAIVETIGPADQGEAFDLLWRFLALANGVIGRANDGSGAILAPFETAIDDLAQLAASLRPAPEALAVRAFSAVRENEHGQFDRLIEALSPVLGSEGLHVLKTKLDDWAEEPTSSTGGKRQVVAISANGPMYADELEALGRKSRIDDALRRIADAEGDVDAFAARYSEMERSIPSVAAGIAGRLIDAGRADEALAACLEILETPAEIVGGLVAEEEWERTYLRALEAMDRVEEAQGFRWTAFETRLDARHLKDHLERLPDFDDVEAQERAFAFAERNEPHRALAFFLEWPDLRRASRLALDPAIEWDGDVYEVLTPASEALGPSHPLAATRLLRAMIGFTLDRAKSSRYRHAARHLEECERLAKRIADFSQLPTHDEYVKSLKTAHGRKYGFWNRTALDDD